MAMYWAGQAYCKECTQIVDVYSEDNINFHCNFCDRILHNKKRDRKKKFAVINKKIERGRY